MMEGYMISDAAKMVEVENHVLRYWEEELGLRIPRNEKKQRFYRVSDIKLLRAVKDLKEQGFQLKAIKMILPDLEKVEKMDPQGVYKLREELNRKVQQEELKGLPTSSEQYSTVTPISKARPGFDRKKTWQERSHELEIKKKSKVQESPAMAEVGTPVCQEAVDSNGDARERLQQFEQMLRQMIRSTMEEMSRESEQRICQEVTVRLQKEMDYLMRQKEELQEKQIALLQQILQEVKGSLPQAAAAKEDAKLLKSRRNKGISEKISSEKKEKGKEKKKKLFAKFG